MKNNRIYIITGPSGVGKSSVAQELLRTRQNLKRVVTCTTRLKRPGEVEGVSYHFLDQDTFQRLINVGEMFEWDKHYGHYYGSRKSDVEKFLQDEHDALFVVDVAGAQTIKKAYPAAITIFLEAESGEQLLARIAKRDHGETAGLVERKQALESELDYRNLADHVVVNKEGRLHETVKEIIRLMDTLDATA